MKQGTSGTYGAESLPNITGTFEKDPWPQPTTTTGPFYRTSATLTARTSGTKSTTADFIMNFDASRSSSTYQDGAKVNPDNAEILYCIKY